MQKENKMGVMPIGKLVITMSLPMMISMLVQALYNVVDSVWVSRVCQDALTGVSLAFPIQNLLIAFASGTGVGVNAIISRSLGAKDFEKANKTASTGMALSLITSLLFMVFGFFGTTLFFKSQGNISQQTLIYGKDYLSIVCILSFGAFGQITCERLMQSTGKTTLSMISQLTGALINIILDPLLILGIGPFPRLEAKGAAIATVAGQIIAFFVGIVLNSRFNKEIKLSFKHFRFEGELVKEIYKIGIPSIIMMAIGSVMVFFMNKILIAFTETAATVFGVYFKLQSFIFMPIFGLNNGVIAIIAYNYGAQKKDRMIKAVKFSITLACCIMAVGTVLVWLMPETLLKLFDAQDEMLAIGVPALRIISTSFVLAGFDICIGAIFQGAGKSIYSMIVSIARQLVVLIPVAYALAQTKVLNYVWLSFPISEVASCIASIICYIVIYKKLISKIGKEESPSPQEAAEKKNG